MLELEVAVVNFVPGQSLLVELVHERIWVKLLNIPHARLLPQAEHKHTCANAGRHTSCVADALHARFVVGRLVRAVIVNVVSVFLAVLDTTYAAADAGFALVVLAKVLRVGQYGLEELQRHNLHALIHDRLDRVHADVLNDTQVGEVFLAKCHPEAGALDGGIVLYKTFNLLVVQQVALLGTDVGVGERLVNFERFSFNPTSVFTVKTFLSDFANVDFGIEVCGKSLVVVAGISVHNVEILNFVKVVLGSVGSVDACYARVETTAQYGCQSGLFKAVFIGPLP